MILGRARLPLDPYLLLVVLLSSFALYPLAQPGLPVTSDGPLQPYRLLELDLALRGGVLFPRWAPDLWLGYGYPLFNFYAPLTYYLAEVFHLLGASLELSVKLVAMGSVLLAGVSAYALGRELWGPLGGLVSAAAYVYVPHFLAEVYRRGDYPQLLGMALLPLVLWCFWRLAFDGGRCWLLGGALSLAALLLAHSVTAMLFAPAFGLWLILLLVKTRSRVVAARLVEGVTLGLGLSAFFWLPALWERPLVQTHRLLTGHFDFRNHFLGWPELLAASSLTDPEVINPALAFNLGPAHWALAALAALGLAGTARGRWVRAYFLLVLALAVFLMLPQSVALWEGVPLLALSQFPWRWLALAGLATALLSGSLVALLPQRASRWLTVAVVAMALLAILLSSFPSLYPVTPFDRYPELGLADLVRFELTRGPMGTSSASEFLPRWVKAAPGPSPMLGEYQRGEPPTKIDLSALPPVAWARPLGHGPNWDAAEVESADGMGILFRTLYFPGWTAYVDGARSPVEPLAPYGLLHLNVPPGRHQVLVRFEDTPVRTLAQLFSLASLLALVAAALRWPAGRAPAAQAPPTDWPTLGVLFGLLGALLVLKVAYIDPQPLWFRERVQMQAPADGRPELGGRIALLGYRLDRPEVRPGDHVDAVVYWRSVGPVEVNYKSFVHLLTPGEDRLLAQKDNDHPGLLPTSWWRADKMVEDHHPLVVPADLLTGRYPLVAGLYDPESRERLWPADGQRSYVLLTHLQVDGK